MAATIPKIASVFILFFINVFMFIINYIIGIQKSLMHFFKLLTLLLYHFSEENVINASKGMVYPNNIAIILNKSTNEKLTMRSIVNFIKWTLYAKIKYLMIYDPFVMINEENVKQLCKLLEEYFNKNYSIGICFGELAYDIKKQKEVNRREMISYGFDVIISIVDFKGANNDLMKQISSHDVLLEDITPIQLQCYKNITNTKSLSKINASYEKYYTRKKALELPEIVITFSNEEICLYGFPFTLLENSEIYSLNHSFEYLDVLHFTNIFQHNSTIHKRFGV